jgi:hypothetical protein
MEGQVMHITEVQGSAMKNIALALGQIEEAMGLLDDGFPNYRLRAAEVLMRARRFLLQAAAEDDARVLVALHTPITAREVEKAEEAGQ